MLEEEEEIVPPLTAAIRGKLDERLVDTPEDPSSAQIVEGVLVELKPKEMPWALSPLRLVRGKRTRVRATFRVDDVNEDKA